MNTLISARLQAKQKLLASMPFLLLYLCSLLLCVFFPLCTEDYWHIVDGDFYQRFASAQHSFFNHNSRIGEIIAYLLGTATQNFHIVCSPLIIVSLAWGVYRLVLFIGNREGDHSLPTAIVACCSISLLCNFYFWYSSNMNWLFPCALTIYFFYYYREFFRGNFEISVKELIIGCPLYLLMGCGNEVVAFGNLVLLALISIYFFYKDKRRPSKFYIVIGMMMILGALCHLCGLIPRSHAAPDGESSFYKLASLLWSGNWILFGIIFWKILIIIATIALVLGRKIIRQEVLSPVFCSVILLFIALMILLSQAPCWGAPRGYQPLLILAAFYASYLTTKIQKVSCIQKSCLVLVVSFITLSQWLPVSISAIEGHYYQKKIVNAIALQKQEGKQHIRLDRELQKVSSYSFYINSYKVPHFILSRVSVWSMVLEDEKGCYKLGNEKRLPNEEFANQNGVKSITFEQKKQGLGN